MTYYYEDPQPEEIDTHNQRLVREVQAMYSPSTEMQSLQHIRERLLTVEPDSADYTTIPLDRVSIPTQQEHAPQPKVASRTDSTKRAQTRVLGTMAASLVATLLVGSLLVALNHARHTTVGAPGMSTHLRRGGVIAHPHTTSVPNPLDWSLIATYTGTGSKTISGQHLVFEHDMYALFSCSGTGDFAVMFNTQHGKWFRTTCHTEPQKLLTFVLSVGAPYTVEQLSITADPKSTWELRLVTVSCKQLHACSTLGPTPTPPGPTPTPVPIPSPTPRPAPPPLQGLVPTPTPAPTQRQPVPTPTPVIPHRT